MATVGIVGGGIGGLSAAFYLTKLAPLTKDLRKVNGMLCER